MLCACIHYTLSVNSARVIMFSGQVFHGSVNERFDDSKRHLFINVGLQ